MDRFWNRTALSGLSGYELTGLNTHPHPDCCLKSPKNIELKEILYTQPQYPGIQNYSILV